MDLVGDSVFEYLTAGHSDEFRVEQIVPSWRRGFSRLPAVGAGPLGLNGDRLVNRFWTFPRWLRQHRDRFDLFHVVDHSYGQLVHELPPERTVVTCHDLDTFRCLQAPETRSVWFRAMTRRVLDGFRRAAHIITVTNATKNELLLTGWFRDEQITVIHLGVHRDLSPEPDALADTSARKLLGDAAGDPFYLLHVGSTAPRKRIDVLLRVFAALAGDFPDLRLVKAGSGLDSANWALADSLGIRERVIVARDLKLPVLCSLYRGAAALLQTSDAEGFGLPVIEALACGCPVVASDLAPLREGGGTAAQYCRVGDIDQWAETLKQVLRTRNPIERSAFRQRAYQQAERFKWINTAEQTAAVYRKVLAKTGTAAGRLS